MDWATAPDYTMQAVQCRLLFAGELPTGTGSIKQAQDGRLSFFNGKGVFAFEVIDRRAARRLEDFLLRNFVIRASVRDLQAAGKDTSEVSDADEVDAAGTEQDRLFFLHIVFFVREDIRTELPLVCVKKVMAALQRKGIGDWHWLGAKLCWPTVNAGYTTLAYAEDGDFRSIWGEQSEDEAEEEPQETETKPVRHLTFFGQGFQLSVEVCQSEARPGQEIWLAQKLKMNPHFLPCMRLLQVKKFTLTTDQQWANAVASQILQKDSSYLATWRQYAAMEGEILLERLRRIGRMKYNILPNRDEEDCLTAKIEGAREELDLLEVGDRLFDHVEQPPYMTDAALDWEDYEAYVRSLRKDGIRARFEIRQIDYQQGMLRLKPIGVGSASTGSRLYLDDYKYRMQIERRVEAQQAIATGRSANAQLSLIIGADAETAGVSLALAGAAMKRPTARRKIAPLSPGIEQELRAAHRSLTPTQREAIDLALNTPDIAIIQGPPGTGKTTVITTILKRLNEILSKDELARGRVLVTSLQHDAVNNVINRVEINSLPIIKFGTRYKAEEEDEGAVDEAVRHWCDDLRDRLLARHPQITESAAAHQLAEAYRLYALKPTAQNAAAFLAAARRATVTKELLERIRMIEERYKPMTGAQDADLLAAIRRLWSSPRAFADGGSARAAELLALLDDALEPADAEDTADTEDNFIRATLEVAASWARLHGTEPIADDLRRDLRRCRQLLLARCIPRPRYQVAQLDDEITALYEELKQDLEKPEGEADNILYTLLSQLEYNQQGIKETLKDYMFAYAATAQQSARKELREAKEVPRGGKLRYDTVIVDEAARVNPGDLLIPLSQAARRIILVGDHRQLPHMYDEEIFERLLERGATFRHEDIQQSMFENLLGRARKLEQKDGIKRFITLDMQYRMHPLLGKFISDNFYARHDRAEAFRSGLPAEHFAQPFTAEPLLWIDVPVRTPADREQRLNPSWMRRRECEAIIRALSSMMERMPEDHPLSIGVISFYSGQVGCLKRMIREQGWTEDQVRVGTVDAYQGMEYDIIFLSVVRATMEPRKIDWQAVEDPEATQHERIGRQHYGFLTSENRLCVALSRQKRLLVVVGNGALFSGTYGSRLAAAYVPALREFYALCEQKGAILHE